MTLYLVGLCVGLIIMSPLVVLALYAGTHGRKGATAERATREFRPNLRVVAGVPAR